MARHGLGACLMLADVAERMPGMTCLLPDLPPILVPVWLVSHRELHTSPRVRVVFDTLAREIGRGIRETGSAAPEETGRD